MSQRRKDIRIDKLVDWNDFVNVPADRSLPSIYEHARQVSEKARHWYWSSIRTKRWSSLAVRGVSFGLLVLGAVLPLAAALSGDLQLRLNSTQLGVITLAVAGLLVAADRIFGWSSGWLRYISTVTAMEGVTRRFEMDWSHHLINKAGPVGEEDKRPLFELAKKMEEDINKLQSDETEKWVAEFNSGLALLSDLIKSQRESTEKTAEAARAAVAAKEAASRQGAIEVTVVHAGAGAPTKIRLDDGTEEELKGPQWVAVNVSPGLHKVEVSTTAPKALSFPKVVEVPAGGVARIEVRIP